MASSGSIAATTDDTAKPIPSPSAIVIVIDGNDWNEASTARSPLRLLLLIGLIGTKAVINHTILLVDTALHLRLAAAREDRKGCRSEERCSDFSRAFHQRSLVDEIAISRELGVDLLGSDKTSAKGDAGLRKELRENLLQRTDDRDGVHVVEEADVSDAEQ